MAMHYSRPFYPYYIVAILYFLLVGLSSQANAHSSSGELDDQNKVIWALIWTADFDRLIETAPPAYTVQAIRSFQRREGFFATGALKPSQKQLLFAMAQQISSDVGAERVTEPRAGVTLVVPRNFITHVVPTRFGTVLSGSRRGPFRLTTFALPGGEGALEDLHVYLRKSVGGPGATTRFDKLENHRMILVRIHAPLRTYIYAVGGPMGVKGFSMTWSIENTELLHRVVGAAANSFAPSAHEPQPAPRAERRGPRALEAGTEEGGTDSAVESLIEVLARPGLGE